MAFSRTVFAPAKLNLGLKITGCYPNGFHQLDSVFIPLSLCDRIEVASTAYERVVHSWPETTVPMRSLLLMGANTNPLLVRTLAFMRQHVGFGPTQVVVQKRIPSPSGLGGASADAAALIQACWDAQQPGKHLPDAVVADSEKLGADIPYFLKFGLHAKPARLLGVGHELTEISLPALCGWIAVPDFGFPTSTMFAEVRKWELPAIPAASGVNIGGSKSILALRLNEIPYSDEPFAGVRFASNDFDTAAATCFPKKAGRLKKAKILIATAAKQFFPGEWVVGMTGSGAALFGATDQQVSMPRLNTVRQVLQARLGRGWKTFPFHSLGREIGL